MKACGSCPTSMTVDLGSVMDSIINENVALSEGENFGEIHKGGPISTQDFMFGFVTIPSVVSFAAKVLKQENNPTFLKGVPALATRGVGVAATLGAYVATGRKSSFLFGSILGQIPATLDALTDMAVEAISGGGGGAMKGADMGAESEIERLRRELQGGEIGDEMGVDPELERLRRELQGVNDTMGEEDDSIYGAMGQEEEMVVTRR